MKKNWIFEQGFGAKEAKKQSEIKVCYKNYEEIKELSDNLKKEVERKNWNFEQDFGAKEAKKQSKIKVCYKNDEEFKNWVICWKNVKKNWNFEQAFWAKEA